MGGREMKFNDIKGVIKKGEFPVESVENPYGDYYTIKLKIDAGLTWIPEEGFILIGTRTGKEISGFKQALLTMEPNEKVTMRGPFGWLKIQDETSPIVMFASGVGITPIRALLKQLEFNTNRPVEIVYSSSGYYLFGDEIETITRNNPMIQSYKMASRKETTAKLDELADQYGNAAYYYNSGASAVLRSVKKQYIDKGIKKDRIISDTFIGVK